MRSFLLGLLTVPVLLSPRSGPPLPYVTERVILPDSFNNSWVIIEYSPSGPSFGREAEYKVGPSGYLKVPYQPPGEFSKLFVRIGIAPYIDAGTSPLIQRAGRAGMGHVSANGDRSNRSFMVFFVGPEAAIQDNWRRHLPK